MHRAGAAGDAAEEPGPGAPAAARPGAVGHALRIAGRFFRGTVLALFAVVIGLSWLAGRTPGPAPRATNAAGPAPLVIPQSQVAAWVGEAAAAGEAAAEAGIEAALDRLFAPVHAAVPAYAAFHYSLVGEYTELAGAALDGLRGRIGDGLERRLFAGFDDRLAAELADLDRRFAETYAQTIAGRTEAAAVPGLPLAEASRIAIDDALGRARTGKPVAMVAAVAGGAVGLRAAAAGMAVRIATRTAAKAAGKTAARAAGTGGGAAAGAAFGAFLGPAGAAIGGVAGAVASWLAVDVAVIELDEFWNRQAFEAELAGLVEAQRRKTGATIRAALRTRREDTARAGQTIAEVRRGLPD